jgi:thiol-disulfide isomerase/thioredoxin
VRYVSKERRHTVISKSPLLIAVLFGLDINSWLDLNKMRKLLLACWLTAIFGGICSLFWYNEWRYSLPTPHPDNYNDVKIGEHINLSRVITHNPDKPLLIHFFNPDCPCSRFNMPHFKSLVKKYRDNLDFAVVVINKSSQYTPGEIKEKYDLNVPVLCDSTIAASCGVYSTPQAAILDAGSNLYFRGNYNRSRYCTDANSEFVKMAIDSLLNSNTKPLFSQFALKAYGCQVSSGYCKK